MISGSQPPWLGEAWREYGQREIAGERHNKRILSFFRELGHDPAGGDEVAWCAAFAGASLERAGVASTRSLRARSYSEWGEALAAERFGAVVVLSRGRSAALGHVGFLVGWTAERLWLLGGNQADRVSVESFARSRLVALRWPQGRSGQGARRARGDAAEDLFAAALTHVLRMEGGYSDDPHDPGGPTNMGITLATLAAWRGVKVSAANQGELIAQLRQISRAETEAIYRQRYWMPAGCAELPGALAFAHFDAAVNHGVGTAIGILQEAVGAGVDGVIGPQTTSRIAAMPIAQIIRTYAEIRRRRYRALPHFWRFGRGWLNRVEHTLEAVEKLPGQDGEPLRDSGFASEQNGETRMSSKELDTAPKWWGQSLTIWGVLIAASASVLPALSPIIGLDLTADLVRQLGDEVLQVAQAVTALGGTLMAIYGRTKAKQPLIRKSMHLKL